MSSRRFSHNASRSGQIFDISAMSVRGETPHLTSGASNPDSPRHARTDSDYQQQQAQVVYQPTLPWQSALAIPQPSLGAIYNPNSYAPNFPIDVSLQATDFGCAHGNPMRELDYIQNLPETFYMTHWVYPGNINFTNGHDIQLSSPTIQANDEETEAQTRPVSQASGLDGQDTTSRISFTSQSPGSSPTAMFDETDLSDDPNFLLTRSAKYPYSQATEQKILSHLRKRATTRCVRQKPEEGDWVCPHGEQCGCAGRAPQTFAHKGSWQKHVRQRDPQGLWMCPAPCEHLSSSWAVLEKHLEQQHRWSKNRIERKKLKKNLQVYEGDRNRTCRWCPGDFEGSGWNEFYRHIASEHREQMRLESRASPSAQSVPPSDRHNRDDDDDHDHEKHSGSDGNHVADHGPSSQALGLASARSSSNGNEGQSQQRTNSSAWTLMWASASFSVLSQTSHRYSILNQAWTVAAKDMLWCFVGYDDPMDEAALILCQTSFDKQNCDMTLTECGSWFSASEPIQDLCSVAASSLEQDLAESCEQAVAKDISDPSGEVRPLHSTRLRSLSASASMLSNCWKCGNEMCKLQTRLTGEFGMFGGEMFLIDAAEKDGSWHAWGTTFLASWRSRIQPAPSFENENLARCEQSLLFAGFDDITCSVTETDPSMTADSDISEEEEEKTECVSEMTMDYSFQAVYAGQGKLSPGMDMLGLDLATAKEVSYTIFHLASPDLLATEIGQLLDQQAG